MLAAVLPRDRQVGSVNVSKLSFRPHVTAGCGGFVDITARAKKIVFSGMFNAGRSSRMADGKLVIEKEGKLKKLVNEVEHVTFSGAAPSSRGRTSPMSPSAA
jgi:propionate CoA-transferase